MLSSAQEPWSSQVLLSLGMSSDGLPLRLGVRDGNTSDSTETSVAIEECVALAAMGGITKRCGNREQAVYPRG
jgi:hypothetical protein